MVHAIRIGIGSNIFLGMVLIFLVKAVFALP
jgi:hypothetical protein